MATGGQHQVIWTALDKERRIKRRRQRRLAIAVGVPVVLIAVIALAGRGWPGTGRAAAQNQTTPQMTHSRQGAQTTGLKIALAFGSEAMFIPSERHKLLSSIVEPDQLSETISKYDAQYTPFTKRLGLDEEGNAPVGGRFVSRAMPAGVTIRTYAGNTAIIDYWCETLFGLTGTHSDKDIPLKQSWLTARVTLHWTSHGWRLADYGQTDGPQPEAGQFGTAPQL
ncbi:hypothetical protein ACWC0C_43760 [Streptomyces sp. NPDC001709]